MRTILTLILLFSSLKGCSGGDDFKVTGKSADGGVFPSPSPSPRPSQSPGPQVSPSPQQGPGEQFFLTKVKTGYETWGCGGCHKAGGVGPLSILTYASAKDLLVEPDNLAANTNTFYRTVRKQIGKHPQDYCSAGGDSNAICKTIQDWWKTEVTPKFYFDTAVWPKMETPGKCRVCHASGENRLVDFDTTKAKLDQNRKSARDNLLINNAASQNGTNHPGANGSTGYQCANLDASPCKEFIGWYQLLYP